MVCGHHRILKVQKVRQAAVCNSMDRLFRRQALVQRQLLTGLIPEGRARRQLKLLQRRLDQMLEVWKGIGPRERQRLGQWPGQVRARIHEKRVGSV